MDKKNPSLYERYAPPLEAMPLILFLLAFVVLPIIFSWSGFAFVLGTILFIVGARPHIDKLSEEGHRVDFALHWRGERYGWSPRFYIKNKRWANQIVGVGLLLLTFLIVPLVGFILQKQGQIFAERIELQKDAINAGLATAISWLREVAPGYIPKGNASVVAGTVIGEAFGDVKHVVLALSGALFKTTKIAVKDWFLVIIAVILLGVMIQNWKKEVASFRGLVERGLKSEPTLCHRTLRFLELYQDGLSILMIGFLKVGSTLSLYYFIAMVVLPLNLNLGMIILFAIIFGFVTAIWKIGGMITKVLAPLFMLLNFQPGFGYFGWEFANMGIWIDIPVKALLLFVVAFIGGALEAYNYTPEKIGKQLGLTKMQMVMTILIWAIGAGFFGMIWGVLLMLFFQASLSLANEVREEEIKEAEVV